MSDVRLTATNPEDSSVVPVACNAKGELKLEEPIDNSFDGNLDGDLSVTGVTKSVAAASAVGGYRHSLTDGGYYLQDDAGNSSIALYKDGTASFSSDVYSGGDPNNGAAEGVRLNHLGTVVAARSIDANIIWIGYTKGNSTPTSTITAGGKASFSGGKAGFTAEGYLWCTTRRGDTVILDATSNGMGTWNDYTPPTRREIAEEKIEDLIEVLKQDPNVSQELPETGADTQ